MAFCVSQIVRGFVLGTGFDRWIVAPLTTIIVGDSLLLISITPFRVVGFITLVKEQVSIVYGSPTLLVSKYKSEAWILQILSVPLWALYPEFEGYQLILRNRGVILRNRGVEYK